MTKIEELSDDAVRATNNSSIQSKRSMEELGYIERSYLEYFMPPGSRKKVPRRAPLINRYDTTYEFSELKFQAATTSDFVLSITASKRF